MNYKSTITISYWFTITVISSVYMFVFGPDIDIFYGVLLPVAFLILIGVILTIAVLESGNSQKNNN